MSHHDIIARAVQEVPVLVCTYAVLRICIWLMRNKRRALNITSRILCSANHSLGTDDPERFERWLAAQIDESEAPDADARRKELTAQWMTRPSSTATDPDSRRARHEAAHALVAHLMGCVVLGADIHRAGAAGGQVDYELPLPPLEPWERSWTALVVSVAGNTIDLHDGHRDQSSSKDIRKAENFAAGLVSSHHNPPNYDGDLSIGGLIAHAHAHAAILLRDRQRALEALAEALEEHLELDGASISRIITSARDAQQVTIEERSRMAAEEES